MIGKSFGTALAFLLLAATALEAAPMEQAFPISFKSGLAAGKYSFTFGLYDEASGGTLLWEETPAAKITVAADGTVNHRLGSANPFTNGTAGPVDFNKQLWVAPSRGTRTYARFKLPMTAVSFTSVGLRFQPHRLSPNLIGGHADNRVGPGVYGAVIAGGGDAEASHSPEMLCYNAVLGEYGFVGGGAGNRAGHYSVIPGGRHNTATPDSYFGIIGGGEENQVSADYTLVAGGDDNWATAIRATVLGGTGNRATGINTVVAGGCSNKASGESSFVAGEDGHASRYGMFVWSSPDSRDGTFDIYEYDGFPATMVEDADSNLIENPLLADKQFWAKAPGGFFLVTGVDAAGAPVGLMLRDPAPGGVPAWEPITPPVSDVQAKRDFAGVDGRAVLERVAALPLSTWAYRNDPTASRHLGPMAQDFSAAFGLGADNRHIDPLDGTGVSLAAIQGLNALTIELQERVAMQERELSARRDETTALRARLEDLSRQVAELRLLLAGSQDPGSSLAVK